MFEWIFRLFGTSVTHLGSGKSSEIDIPVPSEIPELLPWKFFRHEISNDHTHNSEGEREALPVADAFVKGVGTSFVFDASRSYNELGDGSFESKWIINGRAICVDLKFELNLDKNKDYDVVFEMVDRSNPAYKTGASVSFYIPLSRVVNPEGL
jgi:hypothetical protein